MHYYQKNEYEIYRSRSKIETIEKQTISQIFKLKGEKYFRTIEVKTILSLLDSKEKELVLSLGGVLF